MIQINNPGKTVFIIIVICFFTSCKKSKLELDNPNNVTLNNFWKNEQQALIGLAGVYDAFQAPSLTGQIYRQLDIITDNAQVVQDGGFAALEIGAHTSETPLILNFWTNYYNVINRANLVIKSVNAMAPGSITDASKKRIAAEASFLRAYAYLDLLTLFGDIPFYTDPVDPLGIPKGKTAAAEIRIFLIKDLMDNVIPNLPATITPLEKGRINKLAAKALLGKHYLYDRQYGNAATEFNDIIVSNQYSLFPGYSKLFTLEGEYSSENLFEIGFIESANDAGERFSVQVDTNKALIVPNITYTPSQNLINSYPAIDGLPISGVGASPLYSAAAPFNNRDPRLAASIYTILDRSPIKRYWAYSTTTPYAVKKYTWYTPIVYTGGPQNYYMIRYADVLLMYAEAKNELSGPDASIYSAVIAVRKRAGLTAGAGNLYGLKAAMTQSEMRTAVRDERRWEFAFEHQRYFDLQRWAILGPTLTNLVPNPRLKKFTTPRDLLWPYPQQEMDNNPTLKSQGQNPGW